MHEIPKGWEVKKLGEICEIMDNQRKPINSNEREKRLISAKQKFPYYGATGQVGFIDDYIFDCEAILLGEDGAPFLDFFKDKAYIVSGKFWVNNHAHILKAKNKISLNAFICYFLNTLDYSPYVSGTTRLKLNQSSMKNIEIPLPNLLEQKAIVDKLDDSFAKIENAITKLVNAKENLKLYKQSVLKSAFNGDLVPNTSPTHWEVKKLGEICEITMGQSPKGENVFENSQNLNGLEFHQGKICFTDKFISKSKFITNDIRKIAEANSILLCIRAPVGVMNLTKRRSWIMCFKNKQTK